MCFCVRKKKKSKKKKKIFFSPIFSTFLLLFFHLFLSQKGSILSIRTPHRGQQPLFFLIFVMQEMQKTTSPQGSKMQFTLLVSHTMHVSTNS